MIAGRPLKSAIIYSDVQLSNSTVYIPRLCRRIGGRGSGHTSRLNPTRGVFVLPVQGTPEEDCARIEYVEHGSGSE